MTFVLPELPYDYEALEPFMSAESLRYHHDKHHMAYVTNANKFIEGSGLENKSIEEILKLTFKKNDSIFNNVAQHYNHAEFWKWLKKGGGGKKIPANLQKAIDRDLGGYEKFREDFINASASQFGSGWAWLSVKDGKLEISKTPNGENPIVYGATPILGVDVWEHSYYIDYRNARPKYLEAFMDDLLNWDYVVELFEKSL